MEISLTIILFLLSFSPLSITPLFELEVSVIASSTFFFLLLIKIITTVIIIITPTTPSTIPTITPMDIELDVFFL